MPRFITLNERLAARQALAVMTTDMPPIKVIDGVLYYWNNGEWKPVESEETTNVTNITYSAAAATAPGTDVRREIFFAGLGHRLF